MSSSSGSFLRLDGVDIKYGTAIAVAGVSFEVSPGSTIAILGPNGAGKSTLARALAGLVPVAKGHIWFKGQDIASLSAYRIRRLGLAYLPEERGIFPTLTVSENLRLAVRRLPTRSEKQEGIKKAFAMFPGLRGREAQRADTLSGGEQQMLALGRIVSFQPEVLVADEISFGLAPRLVDEAFLGLERLRDSGVAIVLIEQFVSRALQFSDQCLILSGGSPSWAGDVKDLGADVVAHYLGHADDAL
jgi:branched-chain amino acid transport system ATP-binding protein